MVPDTPVIFKGIKSSIISFSISDISNNTEAFSTYLLNIKCKEGIINGDLFEARIQNIKPIILN